MTRCLLALGANLGDRAVTLRTALELIAELPRTQLLARSTWHETAPVGGPAGQASFFNGAVLLDTTLTPQELAGKLQQIETRLGRERQIRWNARTIDIDLLLFGDQIIVDANLQIPHPRMLFRQFVLAPATEIAGEMVHCTSGWTVAALLNHWRTAPRKIAITAKDAQLAEWLTGELSRELAAGSSDLADIRAIKLVACGKHPSLVLALDGGDTMRGPVTCITSSDRAVIMQEALAAVAAAWPD